MVEGEEVHIGRPGISRPILGWQSICLLFHQYVFMLRLARYDICYLLSLDLSVGKNMPTRALHEVILRKPEGLHNIS